MKKTTTKWIEFNFDINGDHSQTKKRIRKASPAIENQTNIETTLSKRAAFNFDYHLKPKTISDLAVHPKKIKEVEIWLQNYVINKPRNCGTKYLLITGPAGSGKSTTVQVLCSSLSISVSEWANSVDQEFQLTDGLNQVDKFMEFLNECKWTSLFATSNKTIVLIEEFPNVFLRKPEEFLNVLEKCYTKASNPVVFICTDSFDKGTNISQNLFPQEIQQKFYMGHISFNSCAPTLIKNALRRADSLVQNHKDLFKTPPANSIDAIITSSMGDIRSAINQYYLASLLGSSDLPTETKDPIPKTGIKRKRNQNTLSIKSMLRDENLGLFHGLGRVLNPKRDESGRLNCDFEKLIDEFSSQPGIFASFLFENYIKYFGDLNDVCRSAEILSFSQVFLEKWIDSQDTLIFALWLSVLGLMIYNEHKISRWNQIRGPKKVNKRVNNDPLIRHLDVTDLFYYNIVTKSGNNRFRL